MEKIIEDILERKRQNIDCIESESAEIKGFVKEQILQIGTKDIQLIADIQELFPIEYGEAIDELNKSIDLFENVDTLPKEVQDVLVKHADMDETYENCAKLVADLESVGYTCEYYLDAVPFNLTKINLVV